MRYKLLNKRLLLLLFYLFFNMTLFGQSDQEQMILRQLDTASSNISKSNIYVKLSKIRSRTFEDKLADAEKALEFAQKTKQNQSIGNAYFAIGDVHFKKGNYPEALSFFEKSCPIDEQVSDTSKLLATYYRQGFSLRETGFLSKTLERYETGLQLARAAENINMTIAFLNALGPSYCANDEFEKGERYILESLELSEKHQINQLFSIHQAGLVYRNLGQYEKSKDYFLSTQSLFFEDLTLNNKARITLNIMKSYIYTGQYDSAIYYHIELLNLTKELDNNSVKISGLSTIVQINMELEEYDKAEKNIQEGFKIIEYSVDSVSFLYHLVKLQIKQGKYDAAFKSINTALDICSRTELKTYPIAFVNQKGIIKFLENEPKEALNYHNQALDLISQKGYNGYTAETHYHIAKAQLVLNQLDKAYDNAKESLKLTRASNRRSFLDEIYAILAKSAAKKGLYNEAYQYQVQLQAVKDSLLDVEKNKQLMRLQTEFFVKEKEAENTLLKAKTISDEAKLKQRTIIGVALLLVLLLVSAIAIILRRNNQFKSKQNQRLEEEVEKRTNELLETNRELDEIRNIKLLEEAKSRFFANVSHEFRTPLTLLQAPIEYVSKNPDLPQKDKNMLKRALRNSKHLLQLVTQVLDLSKLDSSKLEIHESTQVLYLLVRRIIANFETYVQQKGISLILDYQANSDLQILIDKDKIEKILNNYISNAIKFTPKGGRITIVVEDLKNKLRLQVEDTGIGIPQEELDKVFNRYYQVKNKQENAPLGEVNHYSGGTGIGLSLCKDYAELMNGKVWVESPNEASQGSTFYFEFPKKEFFQPLKDEDALSLNSAIHQPVEQLEAELLAYSGNDITNGQTILIVEDNYDLRRFLEELLSDVYKIETAENGQDALVVLENTHCDLIISDIMMPIMDGFQLIEQLKSNDKYRHIPIVMLTARAQVGDKLKALRIGVDDYILKPFHEEELRVRISNLLLNVSSREEAISNLEREEEQHFTKSKEEDDWLEQLENIVRQSISDYNFKAEKLAGQLFMSRSQLFRKIKHITGLTVNQYIKEVRLQTARRLLETGEVESVKSAAYSVGFKHVNYFSQSYEKRFGQRPSTLVL